MTVNELIQALQETAEDGFGDHEVRLAFQPNWPLQFTVGGVADPAAIVETRGYQLDERDDDDDDAPKAVYITEGQHPLDDSPYAPAGVFEAAKEVW